MATSQEPLDDEEIVEGDEEAEITEGLYGGQQSPGGI